MRRKLYFIPNILALLFAAAMSSGCRVGEGGGDTYGREIRVSRSEAEFVVENVFRKYGIYLTKNVKFAQDDVSFRADGYDTNIGAGWVYQLSAPPEGETGLDLTPLEAGKLKDIEKNWKIYMLVIPDTVASPDQVRSMATEFAEKLMSLKIVKKPERPLPSDKDESVPGIDDTGTEKLDWEQKEGRSVPVNKLKSGGASETADEVLDNIKKEETDKKIKKMEEADPPPAKKKKKK